MYRYSGDVKKSNSYCPMDCDDDELDERYGYNFFGYRGSNIPKKYRDLLCIGYSL